MDKIKVLIADDCKEFTSIIKGFLEGEEENIDVVGVANDGVEALDMIDKLDPDVLITDIVMPNLDGLSLLEELDLRSRDLKVIVISALSTDKIVAKAMSLGADYFLLKPFRLEILLKKVLEYGEQEEHIEYIEPISNKHSLGNINYNSFNYSTRRTPFIENGNPNSLDTVITNMMHEMGIPAHLKGYLYLREAIKLVVEDFSILGGVTKELYPTIAKKYGTTSSRVERAIRHAIDISWNKDRTPLSKALFGYSTKNSKHRPTNSEFIAILSERIRL